MAFRDLPLVRQLFPLSGGITTEVATEGTRFVFGTAADIEMMSRRSNALDNSVVRACLRTLKNPMIKAAPAVWRGDDEVVGHPLTTLLENPCQGCTNTLFLGQMVESFIGTGNAIYEVVLQGRLPAELKYIPTGAVQIAENGDYRVQLRKKGLIVVPAERILHLRYQFSLTGGEMGQSPFAGLIRDEVALDHAVVRLLSAYMANRGSPGVIIMPDKESGEGKIEFAREEMAEAQKLVNSFANNRAGMAAAFNRRIEILEVKSAFERQGIAEFRKGPAASICAVLGVPPSLALVDATDRTTFWGNTAAEERMEFYQNTVIPNLRNIAEQIDAQLLQRFYDPDRETTFDWVYPEAPAEPADEPETE